MTILYVLSLITLTTYVTHAVRVCGVPWSLSDTYYQMGRHGRKKWLFQVAMILSAVLLMPVWIECSPESIQFLAFLSCGGLIFVGTAPLFKDGFQSRIHYTGTAVSGLAAITWMCLSGLWWLPATAFACSGVIMLGYRKWMFWAEMAAFASTYVCVLIKMMAAS